MINALTIFGTRPEAIKLAPLIKGFAEYPEFKNWVCVTAQHRQMLDQVLSLFEIVPDVDLNLMRPNQDLYDVTSRVLLGIGRVLDRFKPDLVFVQGDTATTFAAALGSFYAGIPVGHVEAGLRTGDLRAPFPEEANRRLTSSLASLHFCPTQTNVENLLSESVDRSTVWLTGNTIIDALIWIRDRVKDLPATTWKDVWGSAFDIIEKDHPIILVTGHRRENFGQGFKDICDAMRTLASRHANWHFIYPVHLNPNVARPVRNMLNGYHNIHLIEPLDYAPFVLLMDRAKLILTDSGGIQEEAPSLGKPVLVMREKTERPEAVLAGAVKLVGTDFQRIVESVETVMTDEACYNSMANATNPYGDGNAVSRILDAVLDWWNRRSDGS